MVGVLDLAAAKGGGQPTIYIGVANRCSRYQDHGALWGSGPETIGLRQAPPAVKDALVQVK